MSNVGGNTTVPQLRVRPIKFPMPMVPRAVEPKARDDEAKISVGLAKIADEDPTFSIRRDAQTHELVISGMSDLHLDVIQQRLKNRYKLEMNTHVPQVPYLETILGEAEANHRHKKQTGGRGQFGEVHLRVRPRQRGEGFNFVDAVKGGTIPNQFIPAVEKGVREQMEKGVVSGNQVVDVEVEVFFGKDHPVDSSEQAFKTASATAFRKAFESARPALLEPIVTIEITVPAEKFGDISADLSTRRGHITGMDTLAGGTAGHPGRGPPGRGPHLRLAAQEHDRRPGLVHHGLQVVRARAAQRPAADRRAVQEVAGGHRGGVIAAVRTAGEISRCVGGLPLALATALTRGHRPRRHRKRGSGIRPIRRSKVAIVVPRMSERRQRHANRCRPPPLPSWEPTRHPARRVDSRRRRSHRSGSRRPRWRRTGPAGESDSVKTRQRLGQTTDRRTNAVTLMPIARRLPANQVARPNPRLVIRAPWASRIVATIRPQAWADRSRVIGLTCLSHGG